MEGVSLLLCATKNAAPYTRETYTREGGWAKTRRYAKVSGGGLYIAILQFKSSADTAAQNTLARMGPGSATQNGDERLRDSGPDEGGIRTAESGGIRQMGADRVQLDPVAARVICTASDGFMASLTLIGAFSLGICTVYALQREGWGRLGEL